ncbi:hypothetical protein F5887DRAFT_924786 [Amanita rubescens]|nr:hypothetical protein F5887DRAFT_924786 [Amanita rubescens]
MDSLWNALPAVQVSRASLNEVQGDGGFDSPIPGWTQFKVTTLVLNVSPNLSRVSAPSRTAYDASVGYKLWIVDDFLRVDELAKGLTDESELRGINVTDFIVIRTQCKDI